MMSKLYGLIGKSLSHSFSPSYFAKKFEREQISNASYQAFEIDSIQKFPALLEQYPTLNGLNVTIPYKEEIIPYLDELAATAEAVGAVNTIQFKNNRLIGHNTDVVGFQNSLVEMLGTTSCSRALILGTGGAAKAVAYSLRQLGIDYQYVSRNPKEGQFSYDALDGSLLEKHLLLVNTTPLGMYPKLESAPDLAYEQLSAQHFCYDLVYNPAVTRFLALAQAQGAKICNGLAMLHGQAEAAWDIWNS